VTEAEDPWIESPKSTGMPIPVIAQMAATIYTDIPLPFNDPASSEIYTERLVMQDSKSALHLSVEDAITLYRRVEFQLKEGAK
jgi:hypothetical protein